jgi:anti-sigma-K factor RskA
MTCEQLKDSYELYSLGLLEDEERAEVDAHLGRGCQECNQYLKDALAVSALMLSQAPDVVPPSRLKRRVLASVGVQRTGWTWLAAVAAAAMLVVVLWMSFDRHTRETELADARRTLQATVAERDRLELAFSFLNQPETRQVNFGDGQPAPPRGKIFVHEKLGVLLIASNLPPLPPGKTYEMWTIPKGGAPRPAGLFQSDTQGTALHISSGPVDAASLGAVAVTVEPESGSSTPTMPLVLAAPMAGL